ncbi:Fur family transcriptional regulator [Flavihumibacter stibioxidans]|uniref:Fur family transcriptional regulator n=1 Tax=Flavihumibacter stibioxidans TaxID=1834163 RepID=A0ABR7MCV6_9BACT|nr:transcriptional repressor [Flavihumibacter stibioxidans]MBC6492870.1 Fur family transcriptional regulator [Flavihumibacter stibioxidans]
MQETIQNILKKNLLSITGSRVKILELFLAQNGALAHGDIEKRTGEKFDRVTVYRTLQVFLNKGIIHSIPTADNSVLYALCKDDCAEGHHHDNHVHFVCDNCGNTVCMDEVTVPLIKLPNGYEMRQVEMVVSGRCKVCAAGKGV